MAGEAMSKCKQVWRRKWKIDRITKIKQEITRRQKAEHKNPRIMAGIM